MSIIRMYLSVYMCNMTPVVNTVWPVASARVSKWYTFKCYQESLQTMIIVADMSHTHDENITGGGV